MIQMKIKKMLQLLFLGVLMGFMGLLSAVLFLSESESSVSGGVSFLIPMLIFVVCFIAVLYDKG
jgi:hypothetical protein